jgi:hypothetical protein
MRIKAIELLPGFLGGVELDGVVFVMVFLYISPLQSAIINQFYTTVLRIIIRAN